MKNETFLASIKCAIKGIICALKTEKNYKYYSLIALFFFVINILLQIELAGHLSFLICTVGVFSTECINTALEHFVDMVDKGIKDEIKLIKDIAAGSVLFWGIAFFASEFIAIINSPLL